MNRLALVVSLAAAGSALAAPTLLEVSAGLDSTPQTNGGELRWYAPGVELSAHHPLGEHFSLGGELAWSRHASFPVLSDCFDCEFATNADGFRGGPSARWSWAVERIQLYLQVGPQLTVAVLHTRGGFSGEGVDHVFAGAALAVRAGVLIALNTWFGLGAAIGGWAGTASLGGVGGTGAMIIALRL
ncbi:MAG: hypothetical protein QM723_34090 [Myxococcaceae bacterium]